MVFKWPQLSKKLEQLLEKIPLLTIEAIEFNLLFYISAWEISSNLFQKVEA